MLHVYSGAETSKRESASTQIRRSPSKLQDALSCDLCDDKFLVSRDFCDLFRAKVQMRSYRFRRRMPEPVIQGDIEKLIGLEHFQKDTVGAASVFDVMGRNPGNKANIVCIEVHRAGSSLVHDYGHPSFASEPELPLACIRIPMQFAQGSCLESNDRGSDGLPTGKVARAHNTNFTARCFLGGGHPRHFERVLDGRFHTPSSNRGLVLRERLRELCRENVKLVRWQLCDGALVESKIFCQDIAWCVRNRFGEKEGALFREVTVIEHQQELAAIRTKSLNGMGKTCGEQPQIALLHVVDEHCAVGIQNCDASAAVLHHRPLSCGVPVEFAEAAGSKPHVYAGQIF